MTPSDPVDRLTDEETGRLVRSWGTRHRLFEHTRLEVAHAVHAGHEPGDRPPLEPGDPVPGCDGPRCIVLARTGDITAAELTEGIVRRLALVDPAARLQAARRLHGRVSFDLDVPGAGWLCRRAAELPWAVQPTSDPGDRGRDELPVEEARRVSILDVASRLGLGEPKRRGREYVVRCPLHDDHDPSLRLNPEKGHGGVWRCWPCAEGGDGIDLVEAVQGCDFPGAVRWLAEGAAGARRPRRGVAS